MRWVPGDVKPNNYETYIIVADTSVYYSYYDESRDAFILKADFHVYGNCDISGIIGDTIPRSEVKCYVSLIDVYLDSRTSVA